jgi:hypothetical protein
MRRFVPVRGMVGVVCVLYDDYAGLDTAHVLRGRCGVVVLWVF